MKFRMLCLFFLFIGALAAQDSYAVRGAIPGELYFSMSWYADYDHNIGYDGIFRSPDNGQTIQLMHGYVETNDFLYGRLIADATPGTLYIEMYATAGYDFWRSEDYGHRWDFISTNAIGHYAAGTVPGQLYKNYYYEAGGEMGFYESSDYGETFHYVSDYALGSDILIGFSPNELYGFGTYGTAYPYDDTTAVYYSTDGGVTAQVQQFLPDEIEGYYYYGCGPILQPGTQPGEFYLLSWQWPVYNFTIFRTIDYGQSFFPIYQGYQDYQFVGGFYFISGRTPGQLYLVNMHSILGGDYHLTITVQYSADYGQTWTTYYNECTSDMTETVPTTDQTLPPALPGITLRQNYPNPFQAGTTISYEPLTDIASARIHIFNTRGQTVRTLTCNTSGSTWWNGLDDHEKPVAEGVYFYRIESQSEKSNVRKMMLMR